MRWTGHLGIGSGVVNVDLASDTKAPGEVNARLDAEERPWKDEATVMGFEIIQVRAIAMSLLVNGVASAVNELHSIPSILHHLARRPVKLEAVDRHARSKCRPCLFHGGVSGIANDPKHSLHLLGHPLADPGSP